MKTRFIRENFYSVPRQELFEFHERPDAFGLLTPPSSSRSASKDCSV